MTMNMQINLPGMISSKQSLIILFIPAEMRYTDRQMIEENLMTIKINGELIESEEIESEIERLRPQYEHYVRSQSETGSDEQLKEWCKENVIERTLLRQAAQKSSITITPGEIKKAYENSKANFEGIKKEEAEDKIETQLKIEKLIKEISAKAPAPTKEELKRFYNENKEMFFAPEQVRAAHIVKHVTNPSEKTQAYLDICNIQERIGKGETFEKLASENSDCPENAGDLGYFGRGQMVDEFENVVFNMKVGDISDVFLTQFGYHIVKLTDRRGGNTVPFDEVSDYVTGQVTLEKQNTELEKYIDDLKASAEII